MWINWSVLLVRSPQPDQHEEGLLSTQRPCHPIKHIAIAKFISLFWAEMCRKSGTVECSIYFVFFILCNVNLSVAYILSTTQFIYSDKYFSVMNRVKHKGYATKFNISPFDKLYGNFIYWNLEYVVCLLHFWTPTMCSGTIILSVSRSYTLFTGEIFSVFNFAVHESSVKEYLNNFPRQFVSSFFEP